ARRDSRGAGPYKEFLRHRPGPGQHMDERAGMGSARTNPFFGEEHEQLRDTLRRFISERVLPHADQWEEDGFVPREVLRELGELGLLGIRYPAAHGGSDLDPLATIVLAEELGRSTYGGFAITVLVHTDMASPHLHHAGNDEQLAKYM